MVEPDDPPGLTMQGSQARLRYPGIATFVVGPDGGVETFPDDDADPAVIDAQLDGPVFGLRQHLRGRLVLHASAVARDGRAVAFLGGRQRGKSTTAFAFLQAGWTLVSDDVLPVEVPDEGPPLAFPGPARVKLWPDTARSLGLDVQELPRLYSGNDKRVLSVETVTGGVPLDAIYALEDEGASGIEALPGNQAMIELVRHTYRVREFEEALPDDHFDQCAAICRRVPVRRLPVPEDLENVDRVVRAVEKDRAGGPA